MHGALDGIEHFMRVVVGKRKTVAFVGIHVVGNDRVLEPARFAHNRHRAVAQRNHLRKPAGFELARHKEHVRPRVHAVRKAFVQLDARVHPLGVTPVRPVEQIHITLVTLAKKHNLHVAAEDIPQYALDQIEPLLRGKPRNKADQRYVALLKTAFLLQSALAFLLAFQMLCVEMVR